jgi:predicted transcriptional regulator
MARQQQWTVDSEINRVLSDAVVHGGIKYVPLPRSDVLVYRSKHENARSYLEASDDGDVVPLQTSDWPPPAARTLLSNLYVIALYPGYNFLARTDVDHCAFAKEHAYMLAWLGYRLFDETKHCILQKTEGVLSVEKRHDIIELTGSTTGELAMILPVKMRDGKTENVQMTVYMMRGRTYRVRMLVKSHKLERELQANDKRISELKENYKRIKRELQENIRKSKTQQRHAPAEVPSTEVPRKSNKRPRSPRPTTLATPMLEDQQH